MDKNNILVSILDDNNLNIIKLKKTNKPLTLIIGAGNKLNSKDYKKFGQDYDACLTNDHTIIDFKNNKLIGLCFDLNEPNQMQYLSKSLSHKFIKIIFDKSVTKFIDGTCIKYLTKL